MAWAAELLDADEEDAWDERLRAAVLRDLSAGAGALPVVATAARADDAAGPDARLVTLAAKLARLDRRLDDWNDGHIGDEEASAEWWAALDAMAGIQATAGEGFRAKAGAVTIALDAFPEADSMHALTQGGGCAAICWPEAGPHDPPPPVQVAAVYLHQVQATTGAAEAEAGRVTMNGGGSERGRPSAGTNQLASWYA